MEQPITGLAGQVHDFVTVNGWRPDEIAQVARFLERYGHRVPELLSHNGERKELVREFIEGNNLDSEIGDAIGHFLNIVSWWSDECSHDGNCQCSHYDLASARFWLQTHITAI